MALPDINPRAILRTPGDKAVLELAAPATAREGDGVFVGYRQAQTGVRAAVCGSRIAIGLVDHVDAAVDCMSSGDRGPVDIAVLEHVHPGAGDAGDDPADVHLIAGCLLYTSDAADDLTRVDLGGRR